MTMYEIKDLMSLKEVAEYFNRATVKIYNDDETLDIIKKNEIPIVFKYKGWVTWNFLHDGWYKPLNMEVDGYFELSHSDDNLKLFAGNLKEADINQVRISHLNYCRIRNNVSIPKDTKPQKGNIVSFKTGGSSPMFVRSDNKGTIKLTADKVGVLKVDLDNYLTKISPLYNEIQDKLNEARTSISILIDEKTSLTNRLTELSQQLEQAQINQPLVQTSELKGLHKVNAERTQLMQMGKSLAKYVWSMDISKGITTGDMIQQVKSVLVDIDNDLPTDVTIRNWLKDIAPDYAKTGGRPPKDAPTEIPLIMKK